MWACGNAPFLDPGICRQKIKTIICTFPLYSAKKLDHVR